MKELCTHRFLNSKFSWRITIKPDLDSCKKAFYTDTEKSNLSLKDEQRWPNIACD